MSFAVAILLLLGVCYALLHTSYVQTTLIKYITERIETDTGVKIRIGGVDFRPMSSLILNDVLLKDFKEDTLVYCRDLRVKADSFNLVNRSFTIREIVFDEACFHLWISRGGDNCATNIEMFLDSLRKGQVAPPVTTEQRPEEKGWLVGLKKVSVRNSHFTYKEEDFEPIDYGVNWTDIDCRALNVDVTDFDFAASPMRMTISGLSLVEKSGLNIREISGKVSMSDRNVLLTDGKIELGQSLVDLIKLEFRWTPNQHDWRYYTQRMYQYYELGPSSVSFIDLAYFNGILRGINNTVKCSGIVSNTVEELEGRDLYIGLGENSVMQGSFRSHGLPDIRNTVFDIELHRAHLTPDDLESVYLPWFDMNIPVPAPLHRLSYVDFETIKFDGILSDFLVKARSVTPALTGDLTFSYKPCEKDSSDCTAMCGDFNFNQVDCARFTGFPILGNGIFSGSYAGIWDEHGPAFHMNTKVNRLNVGQGSIKDVDVALTWEDNKIDMMAAVDNGGLRGGAVMTYDMDDTLNFASVRGNLAFDDLAAFGLELKGGKEKAGTSFDLVYAGNKDKSFTNLTLSDLYYSNDTASFTIDNIGVEDSRNKDHNTTSVNSDVMDLSIVGNYMNVRPLAFVFQLLQNYLPAYSIEKKPKAMKKDELENVNFDLTVKIKDADRILRVVYPDFSISPGTKLVSYYRLGDKLNLSVLSDTIYYKDFCIVNSKIDMIGNLSRLSLKYAADQLVYGQFYKLYNVRDELSLADNHVDNKLSWCNWEKKTYSGQLVASAIFTPDEKNKYTTQVRIHPGVIVMDDSVWRVNASSIFINGKNIDIHDFSIRRGREYLSVKGQISESPQKKLSLSLENFNLSALTRIALKRRLGVFGMVTGTLTVQDYYKDVLLISDFNIDNWGINRDTLGSLHLRSFWDAENRSVIVGAENRVDNTIPLLVSGFYTPSSDTIHVNVKLEKVGLGRLGIYASDYVSETRGSLSGNVNIAGLLRKPDISGFVYLDSVGMKVNALNTDFYVHDSIHIENNRLLFNNFRLWDVNGSRSIVNGEYQMWDNRYKVKASLSDFMVLNTGFADNESFYGQVYLSGLAELDNLNGEMNVTINARTENESKLFLPLSSGMTEQASNFLHFINNGRVDIRRNQSSYANSSINLNANLELNDHLDVQVIFDPTVGDVLKATGNGNIKVAFDKEGSLSMFGEYRVSKGDYLFTLSNLVNKKFVLTPGGTITWSGSPYEAMLNINAVYSLKTTISELLPSEETGSDAPPTENKNSESGRKVPVECILNLSDNLTNPVVKFDINFPTLETQSKSYIQSLFSSQDEVNKQMFSLLVLNRFYRTDNVTDYGMQAQAASVTTVTEMMSNQLSRWLSQISNNVDVGLAYRVRDPNNEVTTDEIEVALSTKLLNDRVTISANGNMDVGGNKNATTDENKKTNIAGDFDVEVKINKQGTLKMKAYSHTDEKLLYNNTETIQGVGVSYQESFDTFRELVRKYLGIFKKKK